MRDPVRVPPSRRHTGARGEGLTQQEPSSASDLEQVIALPEHQHVEDGATDVIATVDLSRARSARAASDAVRQPVLERLIRESALPPRCKVLLAQPELAQDVRVSALVQAAHGDRSYAAGESDAVGWDR